MEMYIKEFYCIYFLLISYNHLVLLSYSQFQVSTSDLLQPPNQKHVELFFKEINFLKNISCMYQ